MTWNNPASWVVIWNELISFFLFGFFTSNIQQQLRNWLIYYVHFSLSELLSWFFMMSWFFFWCCDFFSSIHQKYLSQSFNLEINGSSTTFGAKRSDSGELSHATAAKNHIIIRHIDAIDHRARESLLSAHIKLVIIFLILAMLDAQQWDEIVIDGRQNRHNTKKKTYKLHGSYENATRQQSSSRDEVEEIITQNLYFLERLELSSTRRKLHAVFVYCSTPSKKKPYFN